MSRKPQSKPRASVFARVLQQLLDETGFYTRAEWSQFLGISEPALSQSGERSDRSSRGPPTHGD